MTISLTHLRKFTRTSVSFYFVTIVLALIYIYIININVIDMFKTCGPLGGTKDISTLMSNLMGNWMGTVQYVSVLVLYYDLSI
jgi:hypothetical protein